MAPSSAPNFVSIVEAYDGNLTDADRALISIIVSDPGQVVYLSSAALAGRAGVHASTVVRLAHKLGFEGYPDLRTRLRSEVDRAGKTSDKNKQRMHQIEQGSNLGNLIRSEMAALEAVANSVSQEQINKAVDKLAYAGTIHIVGRGSAAPLMVHLERRFRRSGFRTDVALNLQRRDLAEHLMNVRKGDAVIIFAFQAPSSLPAGFSAMIEHIKHIGAKSILIGDATGATIRPRPDMVLGISRPDEGIMQLRSGPMLVCEALAMTLAHQNPDRAVAGLEALEMLRHNLIDDKDYK